MRNVKRESCPDPTCGLATHGIWQSEECTPCKEKGVQLSCGLATRGIWQCEECTPLSAEMCPDPSCGLATHGIHQRLDPSGLGNHGMWDMKWGENNRPRSKLWPCHPRHVGYEKKGRSKAFVT